MLDEMGKDIDAVTVSTPDHNHGSAALRAMKLGKHCFCQKPLVQTVYEARLMRKVAAENKLATQMGNQGSAESGLRRAVEVIQAGVIGNPIELHVWTNRPIWPQPLDRPKGSRPGSGDFELGLLVGPAPKRPIQEGPVSYGQLARLVRFWHRRPRGYGVPHREHAIPRSQAGLPDGRGVRNGFPAVPRNFPQDLAHPV